MCPTQTTVSATVPDLLEALRSYDAPSLWRSLNLGEDSDWIKSALLKRTLKPVHDGSYMPELKSDLCSAALVLQCVKTGKMATVTVVERTNSKTASNYHGELLGSLLLALILRAASLDTNVCYLDVDAYCDNMGVVLHCNDCFRSLPEKQCQADLIGTIRQILANLPFRVLYHHVYGHQDKNVSFDDLSFEEQLNVLTDKQAKDALHAGVAADRYIDSAFPLENVRVLVDGKEVSASVKLALYAAWGWSAAKALYQEKCIVSSYNFDLIYHEGCHLAIKAFPQMFRVWLTRQTSGFAGTNCQLSRTTQGVRNRCPCCGHRDESMAHITRCKDPGRQKMFRESTMQLVDWLLTTDMDFDLVAMIQAYLCTSGDGSMLELASGYPSLSDFAMDHDTLGWDNFLGGRISRKLVSLQTAYLCQAQSTLRPQMWCKNFIQCLLNITHRQWLYRNAKIHFKKLEGKSTTEHEAVIFQVRAMMLMDPEQLLPQHRSLLEQDFQWLGRGSTADRQIWLVQMNSAVGAAESLGHKRAKGLSATKQSNLAKRARL